MLTIQIRKHKDHNVRAFNPADDKLMGDFTTLKEALKFYKTMGYSPDRYYFILQEKGIPPILIHPISKHFKAVNVL